MGKDTAIRWATATWNPMTGCSEISPGCDRCYAKTIALRWGPSSAAFPNGFDPTFKPSKLDLPARWRDGKTIFVNSMSDVMHADFTLDQRDAVFDVMLTNPQHDYLLLTKRPKTLAQYLLGRGHPLGNASQGWLHRRDLDRVPDHVWLGTTIESNEYVWRADWLRKIPVSVRFLSLEPLLGPLPGLSLDGISWAIVGGESGAGFRPMDHAWARDLRDRCLAAQRAVFDGQDVEGLAPAFIDGIQYESTDGRELVPPTVPAFYFKQSAAYHTERGVELDGRRWQQYPLQRLHRPHVAALVERMDGLVGTGAVE